MESTENCYWTTKPSKISSQAQKGPSDNVRSFHEDKTDNMYGFLRCVIFLDSLFIMTLRFHSKKKLYLMKEMPNGKLKTTSRILSSLCILR
mmetsp:Transcript_26508/g.54714  ORF Transcript_26508/g.54714 Transcript_26508/m.54714 type:complete len:91 (-) Transcript_26508:114-386(-)